VELSINSLYTYLQENKSLYHKFQKIYDIYEYESLCSIPDEISDWVEKKFTKKENVVSQKIVRIENKFTLEAAIFNEIRRHRPLNLNKKTGEFVKFTEPDKNNIENCFFCKPLTHTPYHPYIKRIKGRHCVTAFNIARFDEYH